MTHHIPLYSTWAKISCIKVSLYSLEFYTTRNMCGSTNHAQFKKEDSRCLVQASFLRCFLKQSFWKKSTITTCSSQMRLESMSSLNMDKLNKAWTKSCSLHVHKHRTKPVLHLKEKQLTAVTWVACQFMLSFFLFSLFIVKKIKSRN